MIAAGSVEYAHARIWARHGARPDETLWRRIETTRDLGAVLDLARTGTLARWIEGIGPAAGVHAIEAALRRHWHERVAEVVAWMPPAWGDAIAWCGVLVELPAWQHLARGAPALPWMADDARLNPQAPAGSPLASAVELLQAARADPQNVLPLWLVEWRRRLPRTAGRGGIERRLLPLLAAHAAAFGAPQAVDGWALRRALRARLVLLLRRALVEPVTAFVYLALSALEFERLRGELVPRAAFPHRGVTP